MRKLWKSERTTLDTAVFDFLFTERTDLEAETPTHKFQGRSAYAIGVDPTVRAALDATIVGLTYTARPELMYEMRERLLANTMVRLVNQGMVVKQGNRVKRFMTFGSFTRNQNIEREYQKQAHQARTDKYWAQHSITDTRAELIDMIRGAGPGDLMIIRQALRTV